ncbi:hypothetical protein [Luteimonas sp. 3794]|uniref:hypothetical protein n=1 Tax=Luteimonas sp. 3794 TaxID=2817730 RepID=UPI0028633511|nr:hypothetical protein [Luteimonas sp. 3794]MDR6991011.1 putative membrane protein [Luteimonas sp. 3794]
MRIAAIRLLLPAVLLMAGCQPDASPVEVSDGATSASDAEAPDADAEGDVVVSTNEPFWQARFERGAIVLSGLDESGRLFPDVRSSMTADGLRLDASDATGDIVMIVRRMRCEDDMSGARFPMTGLLTIDGRGPFRGCARPASMPPPTPPDETGDTPASTAMPARFLGHWEASAEACGSNGSELVLHIEPEVLRFYESTVTPVTVRTPDVDTVQLEGRYEGEGDTWNETRTLTLDGPDGLLVEDAMGNVTRRVRCDA